MQPKKEFLYEFHKDSIHSVIPITYMVGKFHALYELNPSHSSNSYLFSSNEFNLQWYIYSFFYILNSAVWVIPESEPEEALSTA